MPHVGLILLLICGLAGQAFIIEIVPQPVQILVIDVVAYGSDRAVREHRIHAARMGRTETIRKDMTAVTTRIGEIGVLGEWKHGRTHRVRIPAVGPTAVVMPRTSLIVSWV